MTEIKEKMTTSKSSSVISGISKGFYRIALVITVGIVVVGLWNAFDTSVNYGITYRFKAMDEQPIKVDSCSPKDVTFNEWGAAATPKGAKVNVVYCFETFEAETNAGRKFSGVPFKKMDKGFFLIEESPSKYGNKAGDIYVKDRMDNFYPPIGDLKELDKSYWSEKISLFGEIILITLGGLLGWILFCLVIRFIWRGFTNRDE